jgi:hypothetical protein
MAKKMVDLAAITAISESAAHIKNTGVASSFDKTEIKTKTITYPAFWEAHLFSEQVKNKTYSGTWQAFIRDAIREKLASSGIDQELF